MNVDGSAASFAKSCLNEVESQIKNLSNFNPRKKEILTDIENIKTKINEIIEFEKGKQQ